MPKQISAHRDWSVYEVTDSRGRICYIASEPTAQSGNYSRRDPPAVWSPACPALASEEVSVQPPGYAYRKNSSVDVKSMGARSRCSPTASMPGPGPTTRTGP